MTMTYPDHYSIPSIPSDSFNSTSPWFFYLFDTLLYLLSKVYSHKANSRQSELETMLSIPLNAASRMMRLKDKIWQRLTTLWDSFNKKNELKRTLMMTARS